MPASWPRSGRSRRTSGSDEAAVVEHYLIPLVYPPGLTPAHQAWLGVLVVAINAAFYGWAWRRARRRRVGRGETA